MRASRLWLVGCVVFAMLFTSTAYAACSGNACADLRIQKRQGCIVLVNLNTTKNIKVHGPNWIPAYVFTVYSNSEEIPTSMEGPCFRDWYSDWIADYE